MISLPEYFHKLRFFIKGYEFFLVFLFLIAMIIGIIDALSISLLYPMLSVGFQIDANTNQIYHFIEKFGSLIPIGSPFVHLGFLFIFLTGTSLFLQLVYWKIAFIFQKEVIINIKKAIFHKINNNDYNFFIDTKQGDLITLFNISPSNVQQTFDKLLCLCTDLVSSLLVIFMLFLISPEGMLLVLIGGGLFYVLLNMIGKNISEKLGFLQIVSGQSENKVITEYISGVKPIKALHAADHWNEQYSDALKIYWDRFAELMFIQRIPILAINSLFYIAIGGIVLILYVYYADKFISVIPVLGTFAAGTMKVLPKFMNIGDYRLQLSASLPHIVSVYNALNDKKYEKIVNGNISCNNISSDIILKDVNFSYNHVPILKQVNMIIKKGSMTALVGPSGSGKSTITSLLLRLFDPKSGCIYINNEDLKSFEIGSYRNLIGYISQEPFIFNDTIKENICFGEKYSDVEIIRAAKLAHAHNFIADLPHGYDTFVGDQGISLSGGEKQRIVIARAMIRRPELLILDEATSALDNISEAAVQKAIDHVSKECTTLVIAHRLTTIKNADKIFTIDKGEISEEGTHDELLKQKGKYWEMYTSNDQES